MSDIKRLAWWSGMRLKEGGNLLGNWSILTRMVIVQVYIALEFAEFILEICTFHFM